MAGCVAPRACRVSGDRWVGGRSARLANSGESPSAWSEAQRRFRTWRTSRAWGALADHPVEREIARSLREQLGTSELVARVESELSDYVAAAAAIQSRGTDRAVLLLAVVAALVPLMLHLASSNQDGMANRAFIIAPVVSLGALLWIVTGIVARRQ